MRSLVATIKVDYLLQAVKLFSSIDFRSDDYSTLPLELALVDCAVSSMTEQEELAITEPVETGEITGLSEKLPESSSEVKVPVSVDSSKAASMEIPKDIDDLRGRWKEFIGALRGEGSSGNLDAFLRSACEPVALEDDTLVLGFYYSFHKEKIEDAKYRHLVERKLKEVFGRPYKIRCILVDHRREVPSQTKTQNPLVKAALEMGAKIAD
jgi:hypothetical protein